MTGDAHSPRHSIPRILITPGEPAGIGPELLVRLSANNFPAQLLVVGDPQQLAATAQQMEIPLLLQPANLEAPRQLHQPGRLELLSVPFTQPKVAPGQPSPDNAAALVSAIKLATHSCQTRTADALVTGPIDKAVINQAGIPFTGHTELLAELTGTRDVVMLLASERLKVALLTTHLPLRQVAQVITAERLTTALQIIHHDLVRLYRISSPRIAVCGLNPHAGEGGYLGDEEQRIIQPVLNELRQQGMSLVGPLPADSAFTPQALERCDLVLAMYHDQGLPVLKQGAGQDAVNITLGLPIIRTSVDHGTAYDLAGSGQASTDSLERAIHTAIAFSSPA
jgi:4-hydroxythreonine-4-phosphate dehydrogenase